MIKIFLQKHKAILLVVVIISAITTAVASGYFVIKNEKINSAQKFEALQQSVAEQQVKIAGFESEKNEQLKQVEEAKKQEENNRAIAKEEETKQAISDEINNRINNCENTKKNCIESIDTEKKNVAEQKKSYENEKEKYEQKKKEYEIGGISLKLPTNLQKNTLENAEKSLRDVMKSCIGYDKPCN
jgi:hypothetical protein